MKPVRWTTHALRNLEERKIERDAVEQVLAAPQYVIPDPPDRSIWMRVYFDSALQKEMLLRVVVEEAEDELVVITVYKTSQLDRYLRGSMP